MQPLFFIGCPSPAKAKHFQRCMISVNALRERKSDFRVNEWLMDSGAFTELARFGHHRYSVAEYAKQIERWARCGKLRRAVTQDYMCEPFILKRTGLSTADHQRLTIERYDALVATVDCAQIMPVLQGYRVSDYLSHIDQYGKRLPSGSLVGVGSICKRNARPQEIADILAAIKNKRPDLRLHGFGIKLTALGSREVRALLYSCDSMAWSYRKDEKLETADSYIRKVAQTLAGYSSPRCPQTAGPNNRQGRKPDWRNPPTKPIRVPARFAARLLQIAREWDAGE